MLVHDAQFKISTFCLDCYVRSCGIIVVLEGSVVIRI